MLSNTNTLHIKWAKEKFDFFKLFDHHIYSHEVHSMKPKPEIYNVAVEKVGCRHNECIFIDDLQENVDGAEQVGISEYYLNLTMNSKPH